MPSGDPQEQLAKVGDVFADKYRITARLGSGGMGEVWRAQDLTLDAPVALKLMNPERAPGEQWLARFEREAQAAAVLRGPHVVQIIEHGVDEARGVPYIAMELLEGRTLAKQLALLGALTPAQTAAIIKQVARALTRAHQAGIVHRDLKPDNIFLVENEDEQLAKVLDFGVAKSTQATTAPELTQAGAMIGTPHYMSPEQLRAEAVDARSDLWALGVVAYQCLTGQLPFQGESLTGLVLQICSVPPPRPSRVAQVPDGFDEWFRKAVSQDPAQRFQSARELQRELERVCGRDAANAANATTNAANEAVEAPSIEEASLPLHSTAPWWLAVAAVGVLALGLAVWLTTRDDDALPLTLDSPASSAASTSAAALTSIPAAPSAAEATADAASGSTPDAAQTAPDESALAATAAAFSVSSEAPVARRDGPPRGSAAARDPAPAPPSTPPKEAASSAPISTGPDCRRRWTVDRDGIRRLRPECLSGTAP